jgi:hypothetical protein
MKTCKNGHLIEQPVVADGREWCSVCGRPVIEKPEPKPLEDPEHDG